MAERLRILLADDEPLALSRLRRTLQEFPDIEVVGTANDGAQAIASVRDLRPDVVLLDIEMPLVGGFEVAETVDRVGGSEIIFVSAFASYAVQAFETCAAGYLVKPVDSERLAVALRRARERRASKDADLRSEELAAMLATLKIEARSREDRQAHLQLGAVNRVRSTNISVDGSLHQRLVELFAKGRLYRDPDLTQADVARLLEVAESQVRELINRSLGHRNFATYVNGYRLTDVRAALCDPSQASVPVATIALDAGFGSLGVFNRCFKAAFGVTPSAFRASVLGPLNE